MAQHALHGHREGVVASGDRVHVVEADQLLGRLEAILEQVPDRMQGCQLRQSLVLAVLALHMGTLLQGFASQGSRLLRKLGVCGG